MQKNLELKSSLWVDKDHRGFFGMGRIELLELIGELGSISKAAKKMKMSYKAAWDAVSEMNSLSEEPLVERSSGGKGGGGTKLTKKAKELIDLYKIVRREHERYLQRLEAHIESLDDLYSFLGRISLKTSARNQFFGTVSKITTDAMTSDVVVTLKTQESIIVQITNESLKSLEVTIGQGVYVLVKSSWVRLSQEKTSLANIFLARIAQIKEEKGALEVWLNTTGGNRIVATLSAQAAHKLQLAEGGEIFASFDPQSAILGIEA